MEMMMEARGGHRSKEDRREAQGRARDIATPHAMKETESLLDTLFQSEKGVARLKKRHAKKLNRRVNQSLEELHTSSSVPGLSTASPPRTAGVGLKGAHHLSPLKTNDVHVESDILHRTGMVTGMYPGSERASLVKTPDSLVGLSERMPIMQVRVR